MGFLDSILKKKKAPEAGEEDAPPEAVETPVSTGPKPNPLAKLKGLLDHLEKIILGLVLVAVAALSVLKLLAAKNDGADRSVLGTMGDSARRTRTARPIVATSANARRM